MTNEVRQPRTSAYGFKCADCRKFVYQGYDNRDIDFGKVQAVCLDCAKKYEFRNINEYV